MVTGNLLDTTMSLAFGSKGGRRVLGGLDEEDSDFPGFSGRGVEAWCSGGSCRPLVVVFLSVEGMIG
jgi:hypothetical protein